MRDILGEKFTKYYECEMKLKTNDDRFFFTDIPAELIPIERLTKYEYFSIDTCLIEKLLF